MISKIACFSVGILASLFTSWLVAGARSSLAILLRQNQPNSKWYRKNDMKSLFCEALGGS